MEPYHDLSPRVVDVTDQFNTNTALAIQLSVSVDMLQQLDDQRFIALADVFFAMMPEEVIAMEHKTNNHGRTADRKVTILETTKEVIYGQYGGFGLRTDLLVEAYPKLSCSIRAWLRCAAVLHDVAKVSGNRGHVERSAEQAKKILTDRYSTFGITENEISVVAALIKHNGIFAQFTYPKKELSLKTVIETLEQSYAELPEIEGLSYELYCQMQWVLYVADASTLKVVNGNPEYHILLNSVCALNMHQFGWLEALKNDLDNARKAKVSKVATNALKLDI